MLDGVFTDPPYLGNVQYAELMDFCYVWLRKLVGESDVAFRNDSTRHFAELTVNESLGRGLESFADGFSKSICRMANSLKPGSPLAFTYHHNQMRAYYPIAVAILDARLVCSASLPCPAEMSGSIHISGTGSSIVDTVFVCRSTGSVPRKMLPDDAVGLAQLVRSDLEKLIFGNVRVTRGDAGCVTNGHLTRLCIWNIREDWNADEPISKRIGIVESWIADFAKTDEVLNRIDADGFEFGSRSLRRVDEPSVHTYGEEAEISF